MRRYLVFRIAGEAGAVPLEAVREVVPMTALARSPGQPSVLEGFLNLRGVLVAVLRLDRLFPVPPMMPGLYTPLIVLGGARPAALLVDEAVGIFAAPEELLPVEESSCFNSCALGQVIWEGRAVPVLSGERLLLEKERQCVAELQARAQQVLAELGDPAP